MLLGGFEPTNPANERPHTHALDRMAHGNRLALTHLFKDSNYDLNIF
jgi:hypothetical protein